jgi:endonuclease/exonuclease/phosphatase (EEP) superfamily protein YafD
MVRRHLHARAAGTVGSVKVVIGTIVRNGSPYRKRRTARRVSSFAVRAPRLLAVGAVLASLGAALAPFGWPFELFAHFRWQLGSASLLLLAVGAVLRDARTAGALGIALLLQGIAAWNSRPAAPELASAAPPVCHGPAFTVIAANVWFRNADPERLLEWLARHPADVVLLQEVTQAWAQALEATARDYPHRKFRVREDTYGIALLSRWPFERIAAIDLADDGLPSLVATVTVQGRRVQVIGLHTHWPLLASLQDARDRVLHRAAGLARDSQAPTVLLGDLNLTPYAPAFPRLVRESGLRDAYAGRAWRPTWQARFWPLALPLDHVLVSRGVCLQSAEIGPPVGSDHRPVRVTLQLP